MADYKELTNFHTAILSLLLPVYWLRFEHCQWSYYAPPPPAGIYNDIPALPYSPSVPPPIHPSVCLSQHCRPCNSVTPGLIPSISSSIKPYNSMIIGPSGLGILVRHSIFCRNCNSTTPGPICAISSSMEPSLPVDVQWHGHWPIRPLQEFPRGTQMLVGAVTPQMLDWFMQSQVLWNHIVP